MITPDTLLAAVTGAGIAAGATLAVWGLRGYPPAGGRPPARWAGPLRRWPFGPRALAAALAASLATFAVTEWPVAAIAAAPAVVTIPRILSRGPARARLAKLEAL